MPYKRRVACRQVSQREPWKRSMQCSHNETPPGTAPHAPEPRTETPPSRFPFLECKGLPRVDLITPPGERVRSGSTRCRPQSGVTDLSASAWLRPGQRSGAPFRLCAAPRCAPAPPRPATTDVCWSFWSCARSKDAGGVPTSSTRTSRHVRKLAAQRSTPLWPTSKY